MQRPFNRVAYISKRTIAKIILYFFLSVVLLVFFGGDYFHKNFTKFSIIIASYFFMNIAYTFKLKHVAIIDVCYYSIRICV